MDREAKLIPLDLNFFFYFPLIPKPLNISISNDCSMKNKEVAKLLYDIGELLEMEDVPFKPRAYKRAAMAIEAMPQPIEEIHKQGKLEDIPGVGEGIAKKISEFLETGKSSYYEKLKKKMPVDMESMGGISGLGPKTIKLLYSKLGIKTLNMLEHAAKTGKLRKLPHLGEKIEKNILESISYARKRKGRVLLGDALPEAEEILEELKRDSAIKKAEIGGSIRRRKETIGDVDILAVSSNAAKAMDRFTQLQEVEKVLAKGATKSSVRLHSGLQVDLRTVKKDSYGAALQYFTGSKEHNIALRELALSKGWTLNEYGLFTKKGHQQIAGKTEEEVYQKMGLKYIAPELREDNGEIEAAKTGKLPKLVLLKDIKGDLQMHTQWSDGKNTVQEMADEAKKLGHKFIAITDHAGNLKIANSLDAKRILQQKKEIEKVNKSSSIKIFFGLETNIKDDGTLDVSDSSLKEADIVLASIHSGMKQDMEKMTKRVLTALDNRYVSILAHPTGRLLNQRPGIQMDMEKVMEKAKERSIALEINAHPQRLDLNDAHIKMAVERKVKLSIGTDSHAKYQLANIRYGVFMARRGWAEASDIINTYPVKKLEKFMHR